MNGLNYIRKIFGMTLDELGERLNVKKQSINQWEKGVVKLPPKRQKELSDIFAIPEKYFNDIDDIQTIEIQTIKLQQDICKTEYTYEDDSYDHQNKEIVNVPQIGYDYSLGEIIKTNNVEIERRKMLRLIQQITEQNDDSEDCETLCSKNEIIINIFYRFAKLIESKDVPLNVVNGMVRAFEMHFLEGDVWGADKNRDTFEFSEAIRKVLRTYH